MLAKHHQTGLFVSQIHTICRYVINNMACGRSEEEQQSAWCQWVMEGRTSKSQTVEHVCSGGWGSNLLAMASNLLAMASNLRTMASNLLAMASDLRPAMASNLLQPYLRSQAPAWNGFIRFHHKQVLWPRTHPTDAPRSEHPSSWGPGWGE